MTFIHLDPDILDTQWLSINLLRCSLAKQRARDFPWTFSQLLFLLCKHSPLPWQSSADSYVVRAEVVEYWALVRSLNTMTHLCWEKQMSSACTFPEVWGSLHCSPPFHWGKFEGILSRNDATKGRKQIAAKTITHNFKDCTNLSIGPQVSCLLPMKFYICTVQADFMLNLSISL